MLTHTVVSPRMATLKKKNNIYIGQYYKNNEEELNIRSGGVRIDIFVIFLEIIMIQCIHHHHHRIILYFIIMNSPSSSF